MAEKVELECDFCKSKFYRKLGEYNNSIKLGFKNKFCSQICYNRFDREDEYYFFKVFIERISNRKNNCGVRAKYTDNIDIDLEYLKKIWSEQSGLCAITKIPMIQKARAKGKKDPYQASLDRIDNDLPYQKGNVRFVCLIVNYARNGFSDDQVISFIKDSSNNLAA